MSLLDVKTVSEKLSVLLYALVGKNTEVYEKLSLKLGDQELDFPEAGFQSLSELSDHIKTKLPSLSEAPEESILTIVSGSSLINLPLSDINAIFEHLKNESVDAPKLSDGGSSLLDFLSGSLEEKSLKQYIEELEAERVNEMQAASPKDTGKKAASKSKAAKGKPKAALPEDEEPENDLTQYGLLDDLAKAVNGGPESAGQGGDEVIEAAKQEDQRTLDIMNAQNPVGPVQQGNGVQNAAQPEKRYVGSGGLTSAVKKQLGTELETLSQGEKSFSKPMKDFLTKLRELNTLTDSLYPDEHGMCKPMSYDEAVKLQQLYRDLTKQAEDLTCPFSGGYKALNSTDRDYLKTVKGVRAFLENDNNEIRNVDPRKLDGKLLPKVLWTLRTKRIRIDEKDVKRVGGTMSTRLPLLIDGENRFVTPITEFGDDNIKSFEEIRERIARENPAVSAALYSLKVEDPERFIKKTLRDPDMNCQKTPMELKSLAEGLIEGNVDDSFWRGPFKQLYEETSRVCRQNIEMRQVGATQGSTISRRSLGVSAVYRMFDCEKYIPNTGTLILNGKPYIYMAKAQGSDADRPTLDDNIVQWVNQTNNSENAGKPHPPKVSGNAAKQLMDSQVLDYICGNVDRHVKNFLYQFKKDENGELVLDGFDNIDNDMSFGTKTKEQFDDEIGDGTKPKMGTQYYCKPEKFRYISKSVADKVKAMVEKAKGEKAKGEEAPEALKSELLGQNLSKEEINACWRRMKDIYALITKREMINAALEEKLVYTPDDWKRPGAAEKYGEAYRNYIKARDKYVKDEKKKRKEENPNETFNDLDTWLLESDYEENHPFTTLITDPKQRKEKIRQLLKSEDFKLTLSDNTTSTKKTITKKDWDETPEILSDEEIQAINWSEHINDISPDGNNNSHPDFNTNYFHRVKDAIQLTKIRIYEYNKDFDIKNKPSSSGGRLQGKLLEAKLDLEKLLTAEERAKGHNESVVLDDREDFEEIRQHAIQMAADERVIKYTPVEIVDETRSPTDLGSIKAKLADMDKKLKANDPFFHKNTDEYKRMKLALDNAMAGLAEEDASEENMLDQFAALRDAAKAYIEKKGSKLRASDFGTARLEVAKELNAIAQEKTEIVQNRAVSQAMYMYDMCRELGQDDNSGFAAIMNGAAKGFREIAKGARGDLSKQVGDMQMDNSFTLDCMMVAAAVVNQRKNGKGEPGQVENKVKENPQEFIKNVHKSKEMRKARRSLTGKDLFALTVMDRFDCLSEPTKVPKLPSVWEKALVKSGRIKPLKPAAQKGQPTKSENVRVK